MALISENYHKKKLQEAGINIKTKYIVGDKIYERNTDDSVNDDIKAGIRTEKSYYHNKKLIHTEKEFDSRIEYTFISKQTENQEHQCINCGMKSKLKDFVDGCPYCKTYYNIDYTDKDLGSKYYYDRVLRNTTYRIIVGIVDLIISIILSFIFIKVTSRTFNAIDISKIFIYGIILSIVLYYFFYLLDAYIILEPIKKYKDKQNQKQIDFWTKTKIDKKVFFNNFNYELRKKYYSEKDIIDFDILDYLEFNEYTENNTQHIKVTTEIRLIHYTNGKIKSEIVKKDYTFKKNNREKLQLQEGANIIKCKNCGASVDATTSHCSYCNTPINSLQEWFLQ